VGKLPQLGERLLDFLLRARQHRGVLRRGVPARHAEREGEGHQPLLGAVVQIALEQPALGFPGRRDVGTRSAQVRELPAESHPASSVPDTANRNRRRS
jgi:hypothetical protein